MQPFEPYDAWRLGPPIPACQDERIAAAHAIAEYRTPSDPSVGAPGACRDTECELWQLCRVHCKVFHMHLGTLVRLEHGVESGRELCILCRVDCKVFHMHIQHGSALQAVCKAFVSKA